MKRGSEDRVREALNEMDLDTWVYKPPDDARNWKPADYIVWFNQPYDQELLHVAETAFVEVKDTPVVRIFNAQLQLRPSQRMGIEKAHVMGFTYLVVIWWRKHGRWTISRGMPLLEAGRVTYTQAGSSHGVECEPQHLASTLRSALLGEAI